MKILLSLFCLLILVSCSNEVPSDKLVQRDGVVYEVNSTIPFTGTMVSYYEGKLWFKKNYKEGKPDGLQKEYLENGRLSKKWNLKDGKKDGSYEDYNQNGQILKSYNYKEGKQDGPQVEYGWGGQVEFKGNYKDGKYKISFKEQELSLQDHFKIETWF